MPTFVHAETLFHAASTLGAEEFSLFLLEVDDVNARDPWGKTALHRAVMSGKLSNAALLISAGADVDASDQSGIAPLHLSSYLGDYEMTELLIESGADADIRTLTKGTPFQIASYHKNYAVMHFLEPYLEPEFNDIFSAAEFGSLYQVSDFLEEGADLESRDEDFAATPFLWACAGGDEELVLYLLGLGADIDATDSDGDTALQNAILMGNDSLIEILIENGADLNHRDAEGKTALHFAVENFRRTALSNLIAFGADVNLSDESGKTPLISAVTSRNERALSILMESGAEINAADELGKTALFYAVTKNMDETVRDLVEASADVNLQDKNQDSLLHLVTDDPELTRLFLENGADITLQNNDGLTAFHRILSNGNLSMAECYLENAACLDTEDALGNPLTAAILSGEPELVQLILDADFCVESPSSLQIPVEFLAVKSQNLEIITLVMENGGDKDACFTGDCGTDYDLVSFSEENADVEIENYFRILRIGELFLIPR